MVKPGEVSREWARIARSRSTEGKFPCVEAHKIVRERPRELDERLKQMQRYRKALAQTLQQGAAKPEAAAA
jgi:sugar-specific transcriptional regulator TrmB